MCTFSKLQSVMLPFTYVCFWKCCTSIKALFFLFTKFHNTKLRTVPHGTVRKVRLVRIFITRTNVPGAFRVKGFHSVRSLNDYCFNARRYSYLSLHLNHNPTTSTFYCGPESVRHSASVNLNSHGTKELPRKRSNLRNVKIQLVRYPAKDKQGEI